MQVRLFGKYDEKLVINVHNTVCVFSGSRYLPSQGKYHTWSLSSIKTVFGGTVALVDHCLDLPVLIKMFADLREDQAMFAARCITFHVERAIPEKDAPRQAGG